MMLDSLRHACAPCICFAAWSDAGIGALLMTMMYVCLVMLWIVLLLMRSDVFFVALLSDKDTIKDDSTGRGSSFSACSAASREP